MQIQHLEGGWGFYTRGRMDWAVIRKHFIAERKRLKLTQEQIEARGKVAQSRLSQLESDPDYTPTVDTFTRAVEGLGLTLSAFFLQIEQPQKKLEKGVQNGTLGAITHAGPPAYVSDTLEARVTALHRDFRDLAIRLSDLDSALKHRPPSKTDHPEPPLSRAHSRRRNARG